MISRPRIVPIRRHRRAHRLLHQRCRHWCSRRPRLSRLHPRHSAVHRRLRTPAESSCTSGWLLSYGRFSPMPRSPASNSRAPGIATLLRNGDFGRRTAQTQFVRRRRPAVPRRPSRERRSTSRAWLSTSRARVSSSPAATTRHINGWTRMRSGSDSGCIRKSPGIGPTGPEPDRAPPTWRSRSSATRCTT